MPSLWLLVPGLVLLPLLWLLPAALHGGGWGLIARFWLAALQPSLDPALLAASSRGLLITLAVALWSWLLSLGLGLLGGVCSSPTVVAELCGLRWPAQLLRRLLALPRSLHELLWGLILLQLLGLNATVAIVAIAVPYGALVARVVADQLEAVPLEGMRSLRCAGVPAAMALVTAMGPQLWPGLLSYGGYRLECALRSATMLGVFGLGGVGAELRLSLQSLQFREAWTSLWLLSLAMLLLEQTVAWLRRRWQGPQPQVGRWAREALLLFCLLLLLLLPCGWLLELRWQALLGPWRWPGLSFSWDGRGWLQPWFQLVTSTLGLTLLATALAVAATPWLLLLLRPWPIFKPLLQGLGLLARLLPPPLTALLLLFVLKPGVMPAALALGFHNGGIMGRLLFDCLDSLDRRPEQALLVAGAPPRRALLMAPFNAVANTYLAYGAYRGDVILRETVVVGLVGAGGLGVVLLEALSSFAWGDVLPVLLVYAVLTLLGEQLADFYRQRLLQKQPPNGGDGPLPWQLMPLRRPG
jgi:phosphonate transport system permease protein